VHVSTIYPSFASFTAPYNLVHLKYENRTQLAFNHRCCAAKSRPLMAWKIQCFWSSKFRC